MPQRRRRGSVPDCRRLRGRRCRIRGRVAPPATLQLDELRGDRARGEVTPRPIMCQQSRWSRWAHRKISAIDLPFDSQDRLRMC